jgi:nicotinamide-nucleotide amidase
MTASDTMRDTVMMDRVRHLGEALLAHGMLVVTAESCTGGGIARRLTDVPGSSRWFERGFVTYSNDAKREDLGVPAAVLEHFGAVSEETAAAMAEGALTRSHGHVSVAVTGIAGPDGGSEDKPVGTVCFAWSTREGETRTARVVFEGDRAQVREQSELMAIQGLLDLLEAA